MKAVILAGGEGTRLRPLTSNQPKPMMPLVNRPMMEHVVRLLAGHGFDDIVVTVAFLANQIRDYFGDGSDLGVRMRYATCLLYTSPSPRDGLLSRMPSSA